VNSGAVDIRGLQWLPKGKRLVGRRVGAGLPGVKRLPNRKWLLVARAFRAYLGEGGEMDGHDPRRCGALKAAMEVLGKPWNGLLLSELEGGAVRFSVLAERLAPIGDRMLSCRLKELEAAGLVVRTVEPGPPVRVSYALTDVGRGVGDVTRALSAWGERLVEARGPGGGTCEAVCEVAEGEVCPEVVD
jgi:DNA-binding HxlR family transcriptional regulator